MIKRLKKLEFIDIATFLIVFLGGSCVVVNDILPSFLTIGLWLFLGASLFIKTKSFDLRVLAFFLSIICLMWLSVLINSESVTNCFKHTFSLIVVFLYVNLFRINEAKDSLSKVMLFISLISLFFFVLYILFPPMSSLFKTSVNGHVYSNLIFYVHIVGTNRNCGLFWEPGAFQTFLNLALLIELSKIKVNPRNVVILTLAVLTTLSTSGFIGLVLVYLYFFANGYKSKQKKRIFVVFLTSVLITFLLFKDRILEGQENDLFGKIVHFFGESDYEYEGGKRLTTSAIRYFSVVKPLEAFFRNPIFGVGYDGLRLATFDYTRGVVSCTFVNWFAMYGVLFGTIMMSGYILVSNNRRQPFIARLLAFLSLMVLIMSEDYTHNSFFYGIACYGFFGLDKREFFHLKVRSYGKQIALLQQQS